MFAAGGGANTLRLCTVILVLSCAADPSWLDSHASAHDQLASCQLFMPGPYLEMMLVTLQLQGSECRTQQPAAGDACQKW